MKKKRIAINIMAGCLTLVWAAGMLTGCNRPESSSSSQTVMDKEHVYKAEYYVLPEEIPNIGQIKVFDDQIFLDGVDINSINQTLIFSINADGTGKKFYEQPSDDDGRVSSYSVDGKGNLWILKTINEVNDSDPNNVQYINKCRIIKRDARGNELWNKELKDAQEFYPNGMLIDEKGTAYVFSSDTLFILSGDDKEAMRVVIPDGGIESLFLTEEGKVVSIGNNKDYTKKEIREISADQKKFSEPEAIEGNSAMYSFFKGAAGYDFFIKDTTDLYGYKVKNKEKTKLLNWIDSDINANYIRSVAGLSDGTILCISDNRIKNTSELAALTKVKPEDVKQKTVLTLASVYVNDEVMSAAVEFNKKNEKYRITIKDYSSFSTAENPKAGSEKLNMDIVSGNIPDVLCVNDNASFDSLANKGLFANINEFLEKDKEFKKTDYLENLFTAFERNGNLYSVAPFFSVFTMVGKSADVGEKLGWTLEDLKALMASKPEGTKMLENMSKESFITHACSMSLEEYIDRENNKAAFNTPGFISLMNFANQFPSQAELERSNSESVNLGEESLENYRQGKILLQTCSLMNFDEFHRLQKEVYGEEVTLIGFPSAKRKGSAISPSLEFAVSQNSEWKDAAWEFIKVFFGDDFQDNLQWGWPTKLSSIQKKKEKEQTPQTYEDENGKKVVYEPVYIVNGKEEKLGLVTDEECDKVIGFLKSLTQVMRNDKHINDILTEETADFFGGRKSVEETAKLIQNRVQTYLSESQ